VASWDISTRTKKLGGLRLNHLKNSLGCQMDSYILTGPMCLERVGEKECSISSSLAARSGKVFFVDPVKCL